MKKGTILNLVYSKVILSSMPRHTWWIAFNAITQINVPMQGCLSCQKPIDGKRYIFIVDGNIIEVKAIETFKLLLKIRFCLDLNKTCVVPSFRWNLVSISILDKFSYFYSFGNNQFCLFHNLKLIGSGSLLGYGNPYLLDMVALFNETLHVNSHGTKRKLIKENSTLHWHK